jgi:hypothetical protein
MSVNPYNSPHRNDSWIKDKHLWSRWNHIKQYLSGRQMLREINNQLLVNDEFFLAKHSPRMRLKSHLDWVHYRARDLARAIESGSIPVYYEQQMKSTNSPHNQWQDQHQEHELKTHYAHRAGRANWIKDKNHE